MSKFILCGLVILFIVVMLVHYKNMEGFVVSGEYTIDTFTENGTWTVPADVTSIELLIVAGGGGGGSSSNRAGGGGGGGGVIYKESMGVLPATPYTITVGAGGAGGAAFSGTSNSGMNGANSSFGWTTAKGGGGGGDGIVGLNGGSGGGGSRQLGGGTGTLDQGYGGGSGDKTIVGYYYFYFGGGGGGAGGASTSNKGGIGVEKNISGANVVYSAGGSGGGQNANTNSTLLPPSPGGGAGGLGGGSGDNPSGPPAVGGNATTPGSGGGGGSTTGGGGNGAKGIVIIKYKTPYTSKYTKKPNTDVAGRDISCGEYKTHTDIENACNSNAECVGYSFYNFGNGLIPHCLKTNVSDTLTTNSAVLYTKPIQVTPVAPVAPPQVPPQAALAAAPQAAPQAAAPPVTPVAPVAPVTSPLGENIIIASAKDNDRYIDIYANVIPPQTPIYVNILYSSSIPVLKANEKATSQLATHVYIPPTSSIIYNPSKGTLKNNHRYYIVADNVTEYVEGITVLLGSFTYFSSNSSDNLPDWSQYTQVPQMPQAPQMPQNSVVPQLNNITPDNSISEATKKAQELQKRSSFIEDIQTAVKNALKESRNTPIIPGEDKKETTSIKQGKEYESSCNKDRCPMYPDGTCPPVPDMSKYISKDSIPCWGCELDY